MKACSLLSSGTVLTTKTNSHRHHTMVILPWQCTCLVILIIISIYNRLAYRMTARLTELVITQKQFTSSSHNGHSTMAMHIPCTIDHNRLAYRMTARLTVLVGYSRLHVLSKNKHILPLQSRIDFYNGLIQPIIDYGCVVWGNCRRELLLRIHKAMKMCARSIYDVYDYREVSSSLEWP